MILSSISDFDKNYRVEKKIGEGGMGDVYLATDKRLDRYVAVKVLKIDDLLNKIEFIERFRNEAKSIAKLSHPNIVSIHDFGNQDNIYYMVMEYLEGSNLATLIKKSKQRIPYSLVVNIAIQMCNALQYAHENNVIHRDVKPDNIILTSKGIVKLTDFGIVLLDKEKGIKNNEIIGSILYSSPEQLSDASSVNEKSDLYSLGITLYEILVGKNPFYKEEVSESIKAIMFEKPINPSSIYSDIPQGLSNVIMKTLEKISSNRFSNVKEFKKEISVYADQETILQNNFIEVSNSTDSKSKNNTIKINNTLVNTLDYKSTIQSKDNKLFETLINKNVNINNYSWIIDFIKTSQSKLFSNSSTRQSLLKILDNNKFSGFIFINNNFVLFLYKGFVIGALDISKNEIGNNAYKTIPENFNELVYTESNTNEFLPVIINNIITSGTEIYKDLNNINTNLLDFLDLIINNNEKFDGIIEVFQKSKPKKKILYIEDDKIVQLLIRKYFKDNDLPYDITISESVEEGLSKIKEDKYNLIILDYYLGNKTAIDFISEKNYNFPPIILTTSHNDSNILIEMLKLGIRDYIIKKPTNDYYDNLFQLIKNIIGMDEKKSIQDTRVYIAYKNSEPLISLSIDNSGITKNNKINILTDFDLEHSIISIYSYNMSILNSSIQLIIKDIIIEITNKDQRIASYSFFIENNETLELSLENKIKDNLQLLIKSNNNELNIDSVVSQSLYFKFSNWFLKDYFPLINHSDKIQDMYIIYNVIPKITKIRFFVSFYEKEIPIVFYKDNLPSIFATFGNGDINSVSSFIENSIDIKKQLSSLEAIIYISTSNYNQDINDLFLKYTKTSGFSLFSKKPKYKGIIKIDDKNSIQLNLLNYNIKTNNFDSFLPFLF